MAAISGSIAEAYYGGVPTEIEAEVRRRLPPELIQIVDRFASLFSQNS
jgi:ADP-ribosylglycohydrolase